MDYILFMDNQEFLEKLGIKIRILRNRKNFSQEEFAEAVGLDRVYVSNIENGKANPSILYLKKMAEVLEIEICELFNFVI